MAMAPVPGRVLLDELAEHLASGVVIYVATADASQNPESMFAMGAQLDRERGVVTVYLTAATRERTLENLERDPRIAITCTRPSDHKSIQIKGRALRVRESTEADREVQAVHRAAFVEQFAGVGIPRSLSRRIVWWPSKAVEVELAEIFTQTPGPRAGERLAAL
jgi:general stress protein 26